MGLDIYAIKVKKSKYTGSTENWGEVYDEAREQARERLASGINEAITHLSGVDSDAYVEAYNEEIQKLCKLVEHPQFDLKSLGVDYNYGEGGGFSYNPVPVEDFENAKAKILDVFCCPEAFYFRKVNCIYRYFRDRLVDERCWVDKDDCEDILDRAEQILKDHTLAKELLPTQEGFFFGSTAYDEWYYEDIKEVVEKMKKAIAEWEDDDNVFVTMSW